jgi:hypothetical protein
VLTDKEGQTHIKRLKNKLREKGYVELIADNPAYPSYNRREDEITSIWIVEWYFSDRIPNPHDIYASRLQQLENKVDELIRIVKGKHSGI